MAEIQRIDPEVRLAQMLGDETSVQSASEIGLPNAGTQRVEFSGNMFDDVLSKAIDSLNQASQTEVYANQMTEKYLKGEVELSDVMVAQSKMNIMTQLAVTTVNTAVTTFKEITQMQI